MSLPATHSNKIKGNTTKFQISKLGINLIAVDGSGQLGKSTLIPLSNIYNVTVNRFKPECLLCVVRDEPNKLSVLVCRCKTEKDITDIIQSFNTVKSSQTGEGFNTNIKKSSGQNWSLNSRHVVDEGNVVHFSSTEKPNIAITQNGNQSFQSGTTVTVLQKDNKNFIDTAVQTETEEELDSASSMSSATVKEELLHLSQDVRAIKRMLELSTGISDSQHFKRTSQMSKYGQQIQYEEVPVFYSQNQVLRTSREGKMKDRDTVIKGRSTKIIPDHDIRSFAVQTDHRYQNNLSPGEVSAFSYGNAQYIQRPIGGSVSSTSSFVPEVYSRQELEVIHQQILTQCFCNTKDHQALLVNTIK
ncbi:hypothetical protein KUTeg_009624 [Tegillarca granosa]|uniref:Uncharacterized protein n=1 Tax=Tegillarca granosa TaxID=220873 RepID=A0ABQ9F7R9_TEGGR|nr:hypothetical protein KUTeg_009624 [Tegillarca granosa]